MRSRPAQVRENVGVVAAGVFEGVRQDGETAGFEGAGSPAGGSRSKPTFGCHEGRILRDCAFGIRAAKSSLVDGPVSTAQHQYGGIFSPWTGSLVKYRCGSAADLLEGRVK